jgi:diguanylate cyclase (GGDEF)-like protein
MDDLAHDGGPSSRSAVRTALRKHLWAAIALVLAVTGVGSAIIVANNAGHNAAANSRREAGASSREIASTLQLALQHEQDLVVDTSATISRNPGISESGFRQWMAAISAFERYPELSGTNEIEIVPASQLSAFVARETLDPPGPLSTNGTYQVVPQGTRAYYCLESVAVQRSSATIVPAGFDYCATFTKAAILEARDTGRSRYIPYKVGTTEDLALARPTYVGQGLPKTVQARRAAFIGLTGMVIVPRVLLSAALAGHPDTSVSFHYGAGRSSATFTEGSAPKNALMVVNNLHNGWTVDTLESVQGAGLFSNPSSRAALIAGFALTLFLSSLALVLGTGRARAREKLEVRTRELRFLALHDPLTKLPNRALILDRTEQMIARSRRTGISCAIMFLDLDDFKDINDTLGHSVGDELLVAVSARLSTVLRDGDTVGRLGGDEFVLLIEDASLSVGVEVVAERILEVLRAPFQISGYHLPLSVQASIGVAAGNRSTPEELLRDADIALYRAKAAGKGCAAVFAPSMQTAVEDQRHLYTDLHHALEAGEFFLLYQPTIDLQTNAFTGVEALIRWRHPTQGVVAPDAIIPALERSGLIVPVGLWVLQEATRQGAAWQAKGHPFSVSVNMSARQLERDRIVDDVREALSTSGFDPRLLILELTETALMSNAEETIGRLWRLKELGVRIAVDDFGTGYSSLSYLRRFPIDILKIDRSFVSGIADSAEATALVHTLVQLGKVLNLETIAEGVEDDEQRACLQAENVDTGQGFLFYRPLEVSAVERLLREFDVAPEVDSEGMVHPDRDNVR